MLWSFSWQQRSVCRVSIFKSCKAISSIWNRAEKGANSPALLYSSRRITLSVIHSESRKTEQVTMKANFIYFWSAESEFVIKKSIFPWLAELAWIWHWGQKTEAQFCPIFSKNAKCTLTLMSKEKLIFLFQIQILTFKYVWNLPSLSLAQFFLIQNELRPGCVIIKAINWKPPWFI